MVTWEPLKTTLVILTADFDLYFYHFNSYSININIQAVQSTTYDIFLSIQGSIYLSNVNLLHYRCKLCNFSYLRQRISHKVGDDMRQLQMGDEERDLYNELLDKFMAILI